MQRMIGVIKPGMLSTLQDLGRTGYQRFGVSAGGVMDETAHRQANALVGNAADEATLECTVLGPVLQFHATTLLAICGADLAPSINGLAVPQGRPVLLRAGTQLAFGQRRTGARAYLAIRGGFDCPAVMASKSTDLRGGFGGYLGRALKKADVLHGGSDDAAQFYPGLGRQLSRENAAFAAPRWMVAQSTTMATSQTVRILQGRHWQLFAQQAHLHLLSTAFQITPQSDRMGYRLAGAPLALEQVREMISEAVAFGTIQVPPDGAPIILMADRGTTGGYPKIAQVASVDLPMLAQMLPGETIRFELIPLQLAQQLALRREEDMDAILAAMQRRRGSE
ncbi:MAG: biotin-dependent carboxyltransferase family protein [Janthinobacterium lividum]